ncbi:thiamine pyrophosphate-dependent enzyme [Desulforhopalus singaporensis]|uniref:2-oxoglutarate ferredoxin oxidoreductase subunit beta n=1 Tax=Desulforhopalus singaporensis TaxID=91360 RepID=A0A1H0N882_9BACT|nr:thiamine pyrophosphate-dependent enzyme [Desulforhopalus singaporensis]SDO88851.1 2-oxoglutarate ferredoxin oxidoreductase subunit beta [Desulforhopalus singaporensis]
MKTFREEKNFSWCPGCGHGIVARLCAELIEENNLRDRTCCVVGIGCGGFHHHYMEIDALEAAHGRSIPVATGYKLGLPDNFVYTLQGDGDCASIGLAELMHAANRGTPITVIMVNNGVFGMTGGQMSPETLISQKTPTCPFGRDAKLHGNPLKVSEMMQEMDGVAYLARLSVATPTLVRKAKKGLAQAFKAQEEKLGFSFVEILSPCPTGWNMKVVDSYQRLAKEVAEILPVKEFINKVGGES